MKRRVRIGRWQISLGVLSIIGVIMLLGGGAVYARFGGATNLSGSGSINLQSGLVGWWPMNGNAKDSTPYGTDCTANSASPTTDRKNKSASAYSFTATSTSTLSCGTPNAALQLTTQVTVSAWVYSTNWANPSTFNGIMSYGSGGYWLTVNTAGNVVGYIYGNINTETVASNTALSTGVWHLVTMVYDGSTKKIYIDGQLDKSSPSVNSTILASGYAAATLYIGSVKATAGRSMYGSLDDVRIYNRPLSATEVAALYNTYDGGVKLGSGEANLAGWWKLDGNLKDSTPYGGDGTPTAMSYTSDRKGMTTRAGSFNGVNGHFSVPSSSVLKPTAGVTVGAWVYPTNLSNVNEQVIVAALDDGGVGGYGLYITGSSADQCAANMVSFVIDYGPGYKTACYAKSNLSNNTWYHIVGTYDGSNVNLYVNGVLVNSSVYTGSISESANTVPICVGENSHSGFCSAGVWTGALDDVRIYGVGLSAAQVGLQYQTYYAQINLNSANGSSSTLSQGLVGNWLLNGNATDATPYSDNGTVSGAVLTADRKGRSNSAYSFTNTTDNISIPSNSALNNQTFTMAAWVYPTSYAGGHTLTIIGSSATSGGPQFGIVSGGQLLLNKQNVSAFPISTNTIPVNTWTHVVITYNGTTLNYYINGSLDRTVSASQTFTFSSYLIGKKSTNTETFVGSIDDVYIYNRVLSATEIGSLYGTYN